MKEEIKLTKEQRAKKLKSIKAIQDEQCKKNEFIKYENEIDKLLRDLFFDNRWMDENDYNDFLEILFKKESNLKRILSASIIEGVNRGHSVNEQISLIKKIKWL